MPRKKITDLQVCQAYARTGDVSKISHLQQTTGEPEKVCRRACERAVRRGLIDYGVNLRFGWLTEKGRQIIENNS